MTDPRLIPPAAPDFYHSSNFPGRFVGRSTQLGLSADTVQDTLNGHSDNFARQKKFNRERDLVNDAISERVDGLWYWLLGNLAVTGFMLLYVIFGR